MVTDAHRRPELERDRDGDPPMEERPRPLDARIVRAELVRLRSPHRSIALRVTRAPAGSRPPGA